MYKTFQIDESTLFDLAKAHICVIVSKLVPVAEYLAKRAIIKDVWLAVSYDRSFIGRGVSVSVAFQLIKTGLDAKQADGYLWTRARTIEKFINYLQILLEKDGIHCEVKKTTTATKEETLQRVVVNATFEPVRLDKAKLLEKPNIRRILLYAQYRKVGKTDTSFIKWLEAESMEEYERSAGGTNLEEVGGYAEEGSGEEGVQLAGAGGFSASRGAEAGEGGGAGEGWVRLIDAAIELEIPLLLVDSLIKEGRMKAKTIVGPDGVPYTYVRVEEVKKLKEVLGGKREVRKGGG